MKKQHIIPNSSNNNDLLGVPPKHLFSPVHASSHEHLVTNMRPRMKQTKIEAIGVGLSVCSWFIEKVFHYTSVRLHSVVQPPFSKCHYFSISPSYHYYPSRKFPSSEGLGVGSRLDDAPKGGGIIVAPKVAILF